MATFSSILAWRIPWTEKPDRLQSLGLQRVALHDSVTHTHAYCGTPEKVGWGLSYNCITVQLLLLLHTASFPTPQLLTLRLQPWMQIFSSDSGSWGTCDTCRIWAISVSLALQFTYSLCRLYQVVWEQPVKQSSEGWNPLCTTLLMLFGIVWPLPNLCCVAFPNLHSFSVGSCSLGFRYFIYNEVFPRMREKGRTKCLGWNL